MIAGYRPSAPYYGSLSDFCTKKSTTMSISTTALQHRTDNKYTYSINPS